MDSLHLTIWLARIVAVAALILWTFALLRLRANDPERSSHDQATRMAKASIVVPAVAVAVTFVPRGI